ncbi:MAG: hypothetical protein [Caudoviricetes sp.]|nr:MAG: hypothetical protein [Caudoviricetes sp.]
MHTAANSRMRTPNERCTQSAHESKIIAIPIIKQNAPLKNSITSTAIASPRLSTFHLLSLVPFVQCFESDCENCYEDKTLHHLNFIATSTPLSSSC